MSDSDETVSYSEEEVDFQMDVDDEDVAEPNVTPNTALATILNESEELEKKSENDTVNNGSNSKGKQKMPRLRRMAPETNNNTSEETGLWKALAKIQNELSSLKRKSTGEEDQEREQEKSKKRAKISVTNTAAFDKPQSSKTFREGEIPQSSSNTKKQLSSANRKHSVPASKKNQLSTEQTNKQLSSVQSQPTATVSNSDVEADSDQNDDELDLDVGQSGDDPLLDEQAELQAIDNASSEEEEEDGILDEMATAIDIRNDDEFPGLPLPVKWAKKVNEAWKTKVSKATLNILMRKYPTPSNLTEMKVPRMNKEIWRLIGKWQRKSDLSLSATQRYLMKAATTVLKLIDYIPNNPSSEKQVAMQTAADIITMMGRVNQELVSKRKTMVRPCLKGDFKTLSTSTKVTENLFGDNLTQDIKDVQVKRKIENANTYGAFGSYQNRRGGYRGYRGNNNYYGTSNQSNSFLWRGRSRGRNYQYQQRAPHYQNQNQGSRDHTKKN